MAVDFNIDLKAINLPEKYKTQYQKSQNKLSEVMKTNLLDKGMVILNKKETFNRGDYKSQLDGIISNKPNKIKTVVTHDNLPSDHKGVSAVRSMNIKKAEEPYLKSRNLKKCEDFDMNNKIVNHDKYLSTLTTKNVDICCKNIIEIVNDVFDEVAPISKIKINNNKINTSKEVKEAIK